MLLYIIYILIIGKHFVICKSMLIALMVGMGDLLFYYL